MKTALIASLLTLTFSSPGWAQVSTCTELSEQLIGSITPAQIDQALKVSRSKIVLFKKIEMVLGILSAGLKEKRKSFLADSDSRVAAEQIIARANEQGLSHSVTPWGKFDLQADLASNALANYFQIVKVEQDEIVVEVGWQGRKGDPYPYSRNSVIAKMPLSLAEEVGHSEAHDREVLSSILKTQLVREVQGASAALNIEIASVLKQHSCSTPTRDLSAKVFAEMSSPLE